MSSMARVAAVAGLTALGLAASSAAEEAPSSAERALLGRTRAAASIADAAGPRVIDGARALLGREVESAVPAVRFPRSPAGHDAGVPAVDGARALTGRSTVQAFTQPARSGATH
jgi:hypothetical protein